MKLFHNLSLVVVAIVCAFGMINSANAAVSGQIKFTGSIVRSVCSVDPSVNVNSSKQNAQFALDFSDCDASANDVNVNFYDLSAGHNSKISKNVNFNISENSEKVIEVDGKKKYVPMQLNGQLNNANGQAAAQLIQVEYN